MSFLEALGANLAAWVGNAFQGDCSGVFLVVCMLEEGGVLHKRVCKMEAEVEQHMMAHAVGCKWAGGGRLHKKGPVVGECMLGLVGVLHKMFLGVELHMLVLVHCMLVVDKLLAGKLAEKVVLVQVYKLV